MASLGTALAQLTTFSGTAVAPLTYKWLSYSLKPAKRDSNLAKVQIAVSTSQFMLQNNVRTEENTLVSF